jgi:HK97 family phage portal protein
MLHGNAYAEILRGPGGSIRGLMPLHPRRVSVGVWENGERLAYAVEPDPFVQGAKVPTRVLDQDDMLHVAGLGFDGVTAPSPLRHALRMTGGVALAAQQFSGQFFANSARPDYAITTDQKLSPDSLENMKAQIDERHRGPSNSGRPMILTGGMDIKVLTMPLEDMQLLETRKFQIEEIARVYGIPPFMLGHNEKTTSWGSGIEAMGIGFVRYSLRQDLNKFTGEINRKFFRSARRVVDFDTTELERADTKSLFESFRIAVGRAGEPGFMTTEEVRDRLNLKRVPDGTLNPGVTDAQPAPPAGK